MENILSAQVLLFLLFAFGALVSGIALVLYPNPVRAALFLVLNLFCVAGLYLLLNAYFLAAVQVIVYAGAIMVLFLFVIMLLNLGTPDRSADRLRWQQPVAVGAGLVLAFIVAWVIYAVVPAVPTIAHMRAADPLHGPRMGGAASPAGGGGPAATPPRATEDAADGAATAAPAPTPPVDPEEMGTVAGVGTKLYNPNEAWLFPFEITSILLLIAVIGSVVLAKRHRRAPIAEEVAP